MKGFEQLLHASEEDLIRCMYRFRLFKPRPGLSKVEYIASRLKLSPPQLITALGFNPITHHIAEIYPVLGLEDHTTLLKQRDQFYTTDIYIELSLKTILSIYGRVKYENEILLDMPTLVRERMGNIEKKIEITVDSTTIDRYKAEMRAIYYDNIVDIDFVEDRLNQPECGYRALLNEVTLMAESNILPADDIYLRETILPEEKRKLLARGLVSDHTIQQRIRDENTPFEEQDLLEDHLKQKQLRT